MTHIAPELSSNMRRAPCFASCLAMKVANGTEARSTCLQQQGQRASGIVIPIAPGILLMYAAWVASSHSKKYVLLMKFFTKKYFASPRYAAVSTISSSEAMEGPENVEEDKGDVALLRRLDELDVALPCSVDDSKPARTSIRAGQRHQSN